MAACSKLTMKVLSACPFVDNDLEPSICTYSPVSAPLLAALTRSLPLSMSANSVSHFAALWLL